MWTSGSRLSAPSGKRHLRPERNEVRVLGVDERDKRLAQNEALFREVNERVDDLAADWHIGSQEYFCECANPDCTFRVQLERSEYQAVRADATQFFVLPGHFTPEIEALVSSENDRFWVVKKQGDAAEFVQQLDPRSR